MKKAVFIDRDGTINVNIDYLSDPNLLKIYEGVPEGIVKLRKKDFLTIIITNQSGISRGYFTEETLKKIHEKLLFLLGEKGAEIDAIYYCPHHPDDKCRCRKPRTGLLEKAIDEWRIDPKKSYMIGDMMMDVIAGKRVGCKAILVPERKNRELVMKEMQESDLKPDHVAQSFEDAVRWIISQDTS